MMDLSEELVTTRKITATLSADQVRMAAVNAVRGRADVAADDKHTATATTGPDGSVCVVLVAEVSQSQPAAPADADAGAELVPPAPPLNPILNL